MHRRKVIDWIGTLMDDLGASLGDPHVERPCDRLAQSVDCGLTKTVGGLLRMDTRAE